MLSYITASKDGLIIWELTFPLKDVSELVCKIRIILLDGKRFVF